MAGIWRNDSEKIMIDIKEKKDCCGCNACGDTCPKNAISFKKDDEGFLYPQVDKNLCINCGLCNQVCPQLQVEKVKVNEFAEPKCFAVVNKNLAVRFDSTSGGMFSALANIIYRKGGFVGGAVWTEDFEIRQFVSDSKDDLPQLRSSKYAQSDARGFYKAIKEAVATGRDVLVCGTPCQMAALRIFLGKDYANLYIIDFICRGNNSPLVFRKYLDWQEERNGGKVIYVKAKNKEMGWRNLTTKLVFSNKKIVYDTRDTSFFTRGYLSTNAYCRPSCYDCQFKGLPRIADITLADFWGANSLRLPDALDQDLGTSLVLVNNAKGLSLFGATRPSLLVHEITWAQAQAGNGMLNASLPPPKCNRSDFFKVLNSKGFGEVVARFIDDHGRDVARVGWMRRLRGIARRLICIARLFGFSPLSMFRGVLHNGWRRILKGKGLLIASRGTIVENRGVIAIDEGNLKIGGEYYYRQEPVRTALGVQPGGTILVHGDTKFVYGADIEVFKDAVLEIGGGGGFNVGATIVCGERITIGRHVMGGRHITIRDTNGGHWMNLPGYKNTKPVEIGDHVWLCEGCTIMPGVKIGSGAVVGAKAVVFNNVPANTLVMGNPAQVVCEDVEWKY